MEIVMPESFRQVFKVVTSYQNVRAAPANMTTTTFPFVP